MTRRDITSRGEFHPSGTDPPGPSARPRWMRRTPQPGRPRVRDTAGGRNSTQATCCPFRQSFFQRDRAGADAPPEISAVARVPSRPIRNLFPQSGGGSVVDAATGFGGDDGQTDGEIRFPDSWRAKKNDIFAAIQEAELVQALIHKACVLSGAAMPKA